MIFNNLKYLFYYVKRGIKNLIWYFKVIWEDDDYDEIFSYYILKRKLEKLLVTLEKEHIYYGQESDIRYLKISLKLIDKIINGYYSYLDNKEIKKYNIKPRIINDIPYLVLGIDVEKKARKLLFKILEERIFGIWW